MIKKTYTETIYNETIEYEGISIEVTIQDLDDGYYIMDTFATVLDKEKHCFFCFSYYEHLGKWIDRRPHVNKYFHNIDTFKEENHPVNKNMVKIIHKVRNTIKKQIFELD